MATEGTIIGDLPDGAPLVTGDTTVWQRGSTNVRGTVDNIAAFTKDFLKVAASQALASDAQGYIVASGVLALELAYVSGVTSAIQTQLNAKQATGNYITALTGDATASGPGSSSLTLATVNSNTGSFGSSSLIPVITVNAKGLITAVTTASSASAAAGSLTGTTLASNVVSSSLTSVGTLGSLTVNNPIVGSITGNAATATVLQTARTINTVSFDGSANIVVTAAAGTLTGATLASNVVTSSLTTVGTLINLTVTNPITGSITGNAGTVTTNANLTGNVTSVGNATTIAAGVVTNAMLAGSIDLATKVTGILGTTHGGAGSVTGIMKANGSGVVSQASSGTDYVIPGAAPANGVIVTENIQFACSDESTPLNTATGVITFRIPYGFTLTSLKASLTSAPTGQKLIVNINKNGVSIFSTLISIDIGSTTSVGASVPYVLSTTSFSSDDVITADITQVGSILAGTGLKLVMIGHQ